MIITRLISVGHPAWCLSAELAEGRMRLLFFLWQIPSSLASATWNQVLTFILGGMWHIHGTFLAPSPSLNNYFRGIKIKILLAKHCAICAVEASLKAFSKPFLVKGNFTGKMSSSDLKSRKNHFLLQATGNDFLVLEQIEGLAASGTSSLLATGLHYYMRHLLSVSPLCHWQPWWEMQAFVFPKNKKT